MADDDARARRTSKASGAAPVKKAAPRKAGATKAPAPAVTKAPGRKAAVVERVPAAKAAPVRKAPVRKAPAGESSPPAPAKAAARKAPVPAKAAVPKPAKRAPVKKETVTEAPVRNRGAVLSPRKKAAPPLRLAAEQTFADDWEPPAPPVREDPAARVRAVLRQAALSLEARDAPARSVAPPARPQPAAPAAAEPTPEEVTRVLVAPADDDLEEVDDFDADLGDEDFEAPVEEDEVDLEDAEEFDEEDEEDDVAGLVVDETVEDEDELDEEELDEEEPEAGDGALDDEGEWAPPEVLDDAAPPMSSAGSRPAAPPPPPLSPPLPLGSPPTHQAAADFSPPPAPHGKSEKSEKQRKGGGRRLLKVALALLIVIVVIGVGALAFAKIRDEGVDYSKLKVGDCFDSSDTNEVRGVKVEPCAEEHNSEIFFLVTHPAGPNDAYPGKDNLVQFAADACLGQPLTEYLGVPLEQSKLKDFEIVPQESAWKDGRRVLVCGVDTGGEGTLTGSVKGTRR